MTKIIMNDSRLTNITQLRTFLKGAQKLDLSLRKASIEKKYQFIDKTIDRIQYLKLRKKDKRVVLAYLKKLTGDKKAQLTRLVNRAKQGLLKRQPYHRANPRRLYTTSGIVFLFTTIPASSKSSAASLPPMPTFRKSTNIK